MNRRISPARRIGLLLLLALLVTPLLGVPRANACSCIQSDPRDQLHLRDGAFIGTYVGREPTDPTDPYADWDYIFDTETVFKGDVEDPVRVRSASNGAACGFEYPEGATAGLFLQREEGVWHSGLCLTEQPGRLREAAKPFPPPDAEGPPRLLVGGSFGEVRVVALDVHGDTAGYGYGEGDAELMSLCPGGETSTEVVGSSFANEPVFVDVRRLADLSVARTMDGPQRWVDRPILPLAARCIAPNGDTVVLVLGYDDGGEYTEIVLFSSEGVTTIYRGDLSSAAFGRRKAYGADGRQVVAIDYAGGDRRPVVTLDKSVAHLALSPNGRSLAGVSGARGGGNPPPWDAFVVRLADGSVRAKEAFGGYPPVGADWVKRDRLLMPRYPTALVLNPDLEKESKLEWFPVSSDALGCRLFGTGFGAVARASLCKGGDGDRIIREFFSPVTNALLKLPRGTEIDAPPR